MQDEVGCLRKKNFKLKLKESPDALNKVGCVTRYNIARAIVVMAVYLQDEIVGVIA